MCMFAVERGYDAESQVMGMAMEGIDIAVLFPTAGLSFLARDNMDPQFSAAICRAYNDWIHDFVQHSPDQLKMAAMLPMHDVNLACQELLSLRQRIRRGRRLCAAELPQRPLLAFELLGPALRPVAGAQRPAVLPRGHRLVLLDDRAALWREPLHAPCREPLDRDAAGADRADAAAASSSSIRGSRSRFSKRRAGGCRVCLGRIEWDLRQHHDSDAPYLKLSPFEYWQRNCFSAIESGEKEVGSVVDLLGGADNICVSSDFPHFDSSFPEVSTRVMTNPSITPDIAGKILSGGARLYGFGEADFAKADAAMQRRGNLRGRAGPSGSE